MRRWTGMAVAAAGRPEITARFQVAQQAVYDQHGVGKVSWEPSPSDLASLLLVVVLDEREQMIAGCRVHLRGWRAPLPIEDALQPWPALRRRLAVVLAEPCAELSGMWVAGHGRRSGLNVWLAQVGMATARWAGCGIGAIYRRRKSKPALVAAAIRGMPPSRVFASEDPRADLCAIVRRECDRYAGQPDRVPGLISAMQSDEGIQAAVREGYSVEDYRVILGRVLGPDHPPDPAGRADPGGSSPAGYVLAGSAAAGRDHRGHPRARRDIGRGGCAVRGLQCLCAVPAPADAVCCC